MFNKSTRIHESTLALDRRAGDAGPLHRLTPDAFLPATPHPNAGTRGLDIVRRDRDGRARAESLMLASVWLGSAAVVLAAMVELIRSA